MKKHLLIVIISLTLVVLMSMILFMRPPSAAQTPQASEPTTMPRKTVKATGNLQAGGTVNLYANTTGIVTKLYVKNNDTVVRGQKIADIKSTATEKDAINAKATYQQALATLKSAQANKSTLQSQLESARKSVIDAANAENNLQDRLNTSKRNPSTGKDYTQEEIDSIRSATVSARQAFTAAESKYQDADISIQSAQSSLELAKLNLDATKDATLKANADGTLLNFGIQEGDLVRVGADGLEIPVSPVGVITDLSKYAIKLSINETRIAQVKEGQRASIIFDSQKDVTYSGYVRMKDTIGTSNQGLVSYNVYITPSSIFPENIKPGMTAEIEINVE